MQENRERKVSKFSFRLLLARYICLGIIDTGTFDQEFFPFSHRKPTREGGSFYSMMLKRGIRKPLG